tara:strand:+ start:729 stop:1325 length:597 start_codon:yes stop_codon:yes gene_type:complete
MGLISNGTTIFNNGAISLSVGSLQFISKSTASSSSSVDITSGIDSTYKEYIFFFNNIHPASDDVIFHFQANASGGSGFNETITSTQFRSTHGEDGSSGAISYLTGADQAQGTSYQLLAGSVGNDNDQGVSGYLHIFNPADTTFVKNFKGCCNSIAHSNRTNHQYVGGYFNTTSALTQFSFKFSSGNVDSGDIILYGVN